MGYLGSGKGIEELYLMGILKKGYEIYKIWFLLLLLFL